jgi:hypothetical protein
MGTTSNRGNESWQALAVPREMRVTQRSRASQAFEERLRLLLAGYDGTDIAGCWIDFCKPTREPVFVKAPNAATDDAA